MSLPIQVLSEPGQDSPLRPDAQPLRAAAENASLRVLLEISKVLLRVGLIVRSAAQPTILNRPRHPLRFPSTFACSSSRHRCALERRPAGDTSPLPAAPRLLTVSRKLPEVFTGCHSVLERMKLPPSLSSPRVLNLGFFVVVATGMIALATHLFPSGPAYAPIAVAVNIVSSVIYTNWTRIIARRAQTTPGFYEFFGKSVRSHGVTLIFSRREVEEPETFRFTYPFSSALKFPTENGPDGVERTQIPTPEGVCAWLADEDVRAAASLGALFGFQSRKFIKARTDSDALGREYHSTPTIAVGLGFTAHTRRLITRAKANRVVTIDWKDRGRGLVWFATRCVLSMHGPGT